MEDVFSGLKYKNESEIKEQIDKNYQFIKELEKLT